jgi:translation initiation factor 2A
VIAQWKVLYPIVKAYVSPLGTHVLTWHYPPRTKPGEAEPPAEAFDNLQVWDAKKGLVVSRSKVKNAPEAHLWPLIQWTSDERYCARMTTNTVLIMDGANVDGKPVHGIHVDNIAQFSLVLGGAKRKDGSHVKQYRVGTFTPERGNRMAQVCIYRVHVPEELDDKDRPPPADPVVKEASKTFGRGQQVDFLWNHLASALIIKAFSAVDTSGGSYYGTYDCFYLRSDMSVDVALRPKREGTIHDVEWDQTGRRFAMVYGSQPASATVYNLKANPITEFGTGSRNFASFSPCGNMLALAGFGSLKGAIEIWDPKSVKKAAMAESFAASTFLWSPDSRYFLTAVLSDRMKVDNAVRIFSYDGTLLKEINTENKTRLLK